MDNNECTTLTIKLTFELELVELLNVSCVSQVRGLSTGRWQGSILVHCILKYQLVSE